MHPLYDTQLPKDNTVYCSTCPILFALDVVGGKWKLPILWQLYGSKVVRYNELKRNIVGISNMMLSKCLKELEENSLVVRVQYNEIPPRVEYSLTERGQLLIPALQELYTWGQDQMALCGSEAERLHEKK